MKFEDISVIVQGAVDPKTTPECLISIRKHIPGSKIILSTWKGTDLSTCKDLYDDIVLSDDPGGCFYCKNKDSKLNNVNRQIVSTYNGIKAANTTYVFKFRTDFYLTGNKFLKYFGKYNKFNKNFHLVSERLLSCSIYARNPKYPILPLPMHPSDFVFFGLKDDVIKLFNIPLMTEQQANYFKDKESPKIHGKNSNFLHQFHPEQYIWINFLNYPKCKYLSDNNKEITKDTILSFVNNLVLLSPNNLNIGSFKKRLFKDSCPESCLSFQEWQYFYHKYCDKSFKITILVMIFVIRRKILSNYVYIKTLRLFFRYKRTEKKVLIKILKIPVFKYTIKNNA